MFNVTHRSAPPALDLYRRLLPGREILTVEATSLAIAGGALRCVTLNIPDLGHPMAFDDTPMRESGAAFAGAASGGFRASRAGGFVTGGGGWYGPRRSVLQMDV